MKKGVLIVLILSALILLLSFLSASTLAIYRDEDPTNPAWSSVPPGMDAMWVSDEIMWTNQGGMPLFTVWWQNTDAAATITCRVRLVGYNASWTTGWRVDALSSMDTSDAFQTVTDNYGIGTYGVYTDYYTQPGPAYQTMGAGQMFSAFIDVPDTATESIVTIQFNLTRNGVTTSENATLYVQSPTPYNIKLASTDFVDSIEPDETISHDFTIVNYGTNTVDVGLTYDISMVDEDNDPIATTEWEIVFFDELNRKITVYQDISSTSTVQPRMVLYVPSSEDAPADATLTIRITGNVMNDTRYGSNLEVGDNIKTSDRFEAESGGSWLDWFDLGTGNYLISLALIFIIIFIFVVIVIFIIYPRVSRTGRRGRK